MIDDLDKSIRTLLIEELSMREEDITFDQPKREASAKWSQPTLNFFLYDVRENAQLRQHQMERTEPPPNGNGGQHGMVFQKRPPMRVDCFYIVTAWAQHPLDAHRLLTNCLMVLYKHTQLPNECLQGRLGEPLFPVRARVANHDVLTNPAEVWSSLDNEMRASFSYVVTLALDPWKPEGVHQVETVRIKMGPGEIESVPPDPTKPRPIAIKQRPTEEIASRRLPRIRATFDEMIDIGGQVRNNGKPVTDIEVHIKDTGLYTRTDAGGHFRFGRIWFKDEEITLIADPNGPRRTEHKTQVVATKLGQFDIEV